MTTLGVLVGNRGFFPAELCEQGRKTILSVLKEEGLEAVALSPKDTKYGSVEIACRTRASARSSSRPTGRRSTGSSSRCPNFGDERGIADAIRLSGPGRARAGARVPRRAGADEHRAPP